MQVSTRRHHRNSMEIQDLRAGGLTESSSTSIKAQRRTGPIYQAVRLKTPSDVNCTPMNHKSFPNAPKRAMSIRFSIKGISLNVA